MNDAADTAMGWDPLLRQHCHGIALDYNRALRNTAGVVTAAAFVVLVGFASHLGRHAGDWTTIAWCAPVVGCWAATLAGLGCAHLRSERALAGLYDTSSDSSRRSARWLWCHSRAERLPPSAVCNTDLLAAGLRCWMLQRLDPAGLEIAVAIAAEVDLPYTLALAELAATLT